MQNRLGLLVVETDEGYAVQLYEDVPKALTSFRNLNRAMDNRKGRAVFLDVAFREDGTAQTDTHVRQLPTPPQKGKTHCRLGEEPVTLEPGKEGDLA